MSSLSGRKKAPASAQAKVTPNNKKITPKLDLGETVEYMENRCFNMSTLEDGVVTLGDLWDCRNNQALGNLFETNPGPEHLQCCPVEAVDYEFFNAKNAEETLKSMDVSAEMSMEVALAGITVSLSGSLAFEYSDASSFNEEDIRISYKRIGHQIRVRPTARAIISPIIKQQLKSEQITATHYVQAMCLGGQAYGTVRFSEKVSDKKLKLEGMVQASIDFDLGKNKPEPLAEGAKRAVSDEGSGIDETSGGGVAEKLKTLSNMTRSLKGLRAAEGKDGFSGSREATLKLLDTTHKNTHETRVSLKAQPRFKKSPTNVTEMFDEIDRLDEVIDEQLHFPELGPNICGVPISFRMVPIARILDDPPVVDPTYKIMSEAIQKEFTAMVTTIQDFTNTEYIKSLVNQRAPALAIILQDNQNKITKEIVTLSNELAVAAKLLRNEVQIFYNDYKNGDKTDNDVYDFFDHFDSKLDILGTLQKIEQFVVDGRKELSGIRASDVVNLVDEHDAATIRFFTSDLELEEWYNPERTIKILLWTNQEERAPGGVFLKLFDMSATLKRHGVEIGIAFPNVSKDFSLEFKTQKKITKYSSDEIPFFLEVLGIAVDEGETISTIFYSLNACLSGVHLPMVDHLDDIPSLVTVMDEYKDARVCETYVQLLAALTEKEDTWNFVLPLQALNTGVEMMRFYRQLSRSIPERFPRLKYRFLISKLSNTDRQDSPLLFIFKDDICQAVCLDQLELLILMEQLGKPSPDLSLISYKRMKESCFYTPRVDFATDIIQNLILDHPTWISAPVQPWPMYPNNEDEALESAMDFMRAACMRDEPTILTCVALRAIESTAALQVTTLEPFGWADSHFQPLKWREVEWDALLGTLNNILEESAPTLIKIAGTLKELKEITETATSAEINKAIDDLTRFLFNPTSLRQFQTYSWRGQTINEDDVYKDLKEEVTSYIGLSADTRKRSVIAAFQAFYLKTYQSPENFYLVNFITLVEGLAKTFEENKYATFKHLLNNMARKYCKRLSPQSVEIPDIEVLAVPRVTTDMENYPNAWRRIQEALARRQLFKVLDILAQIRYHPLLYIIHQELFNLTVLPASQAVKSIIEKLGNPDLGYISLDGGLEVIWNNPKFLYLLRQVIDNDGVLGSLFNFFSNLAQQQRQLSIKAEDDDEGMILLQDFEEENTIQFPKYVPSDIVEKVRPLFAIRKGPVFNWLNSGWANVQTLIDQFQIIATRRQIPLEFPETFRANVALVDEIQTFMKEAKCLYFWNDDNSYFERPWSVVTFQKALDLLMAQVEAEKVKHQPVKLPPIDAPQSKDAINAVKEERELSDAWQRFSNNKTLPLVTAKDFLLVEKLRPLEMLEYEDLPSSCDVILAYVLQQTKMSNSIILSPTVVSKFINYPLPGPRPGEIDFGEGIPRKSHGLLMARSDIQSALVYTADPFVVHQILETMVHGPVALPLIVPNIHYVPLVDPKAASSDGETPSASSKLLFPSLQSLIVPEMEALVPQPHLFQTPFRFVVTLRVGDTTPDPGRSSLINELLLRDQNMFSCWNEPGKAAGKSLGRNGLLEFTWLSPTTCEESFWTGTVQPEYQSQRKEMILLGNLHGDATQFGSIFETLKPIVSSYVVFWKASNWNDLKAKKKILSKAMASVGKTQVLHVILYPDSSIAQQVHQQDLILKGEDSSMAQINRAKLQRIFKEAIRPSVKAEIPDEGSRPLETSPVQSQSLFSFTGLGGSKELTTSIPINMKVQDQLSNVHSSAIVSFLQNHSIEKVNKSALEENSTLVGEFLDLFKNLLGSSSQNRMNGLLHLQYELSYMSKVSSQETVERIKVLRNKIRQKYLTENNPEETWVLEMQDEIKMYLERLRFKTLSIQDIFRSLNTFTHGEDYVPNYYQYLREGFPVELLHSSYGEGMLETPLREILQTLGSSTRIFVISIAGLKESGKSTLLNRLFGNGFIEHSSTFGLQMRLFWLNAELSWEFGCDAFVVIDSEGLGAPENMVDAGADNWERRTLTLLLGMSDLTIMNVLGSEMEEISDILQVAFTGLTKIDKLAVMPDLLIVQQEVPGLISVLGDQFNRSIEETKSFSKTRSLEAGVRIPEAHRLKVIKSQFSQSKTIHPIRPLGNVYEQKEDYANYQHDIQSLYVKILKKCLETKRHRQTIESWCGQTEAMWSATRSLDLPFNYPSVRAIEVQLDLDMRIGEVKEAIAEAFLVHEKLIDEDFPDCVDDIFESSSNHHSVDLTTKIDLFIKNKVNTELKKVINTCTLNASADAGDTARRLRKSIALAAAATPISPDACSACAKAYTLREALFADIVGKKRSFLIEDEISYHTTEVREAIFQRFEQSFIARQLIEGKFATGILQGLQAAASNDGEKWEKALQFISTKQTVIPGRGRVDDELQEVYKNLAHVTSRHLPRGDYAFPQLDKIAAFDVEQYNAALESSMNSPKRERMNWVEHEWLVTKLEDIPSKMFQDYDVNIFKIGMVYELQRRIQQLIDLSEEYCGEKLLPNFMWEVHFYGIQLFSKLVNERQEAWDQQHNPLTILLQRMEDPDDDLFEQVNAYPDDKDGVLPAP